MAALSYPQAGYRPGASSRDRGAALALAIALTLALVLLLVRLGALPLPGAKAPGALTTFTFRGDSEAPKRAVAQPKAARKATAKTAPRARPLVQATTSPVAVPNWTQTSHDELAALDTAMTTAHGARAAPADGADGSASDDGGGSGGGAGGAAGDRLFAADWYKRPSDAELAPYFGRARARAGWGEIACRTAPRFRVEDCRELEESPGSGIARALREAAWQFQVLPPRINGRPQVGAWVRIHFDLIEGFKER